MIERDDLRISIWRWGLKTAYSDGGGLTVSSFVWTNCITLLCQPRKKMRGHKRRLRHHRQSGQSSAQLLTSIDPEVAIIPENIQMHIIFIR